MAALAPIPSASERIATTVTNGVLNSIRKASLRLRMAVGAIGERAGDSPFPTGDHKHRSWLTERADGRRRVRRADGPNGEGDGRRKWRTTEMPNGVKSANAKRRQRRWTRLL